MNAIQILSQIFGAQPWVERLGLTLLHFVWEGAIIVSVYAAVRAWGARTMTSNGRYLLACAALAAMAIAPLAMWVILREPSPESVAVTFTAPLSAARTESAGSLLCPSRAT